MGSANFSSMVNDNARRKNFVKTTIVFLKKYKFDGLGNLFIQNIRKNLVFSKLKKKLLNINFFNLSTFMYLM